ncbi:MAG: type III toxin-antitoxin system ToxN/AbiQ family toxin [Butyrivibrio sp.]|nr:type III toxin-antitoxin system ToxN/AbiQ family toxin [Acetatifactor muris]MCM1559272.1 type III toxin-antitoxin system ToxN/AbiQ family toxin [Butyrivibrio sp.]
MNFAFYTVDTTYCDFLRKTDLRVPYTMDQKSIRPFVGIVFSVNSFHYYAPLTSPKHKHLHMKNQLDFLKIKDGEWGAINFNNMIPVPPACLTKVEFRILETDTKPDIDYKNLLSNQLSWCNTHKDTILKQAEKLYSMIIHRKAWNTLAERCCDFTLCEQQCLLYEEGFSKT